jgi:hypothetical protein
MAPITPVPYCVGELGPELIIPSTFGTVIPNWPLHLTTKRKRGQEMTHKPYDTSFVICPLTEQDDCGNGARVDVDVSDCKYFDVTIQIPTPVFPFPNYTAVFRANGLDAMMDWFSSYGLTYKRDYWLDFMTFYRVRVLLPPQHTDLLVLAKLTFGGSSNDPE